MHHLFELPCIMVPRVTPLGRLVSSRPVRQGAGMVAFSPSGRGGGGPWRRVVGGEGAFPAAARLTNTTWRPGPGAVGGQGSGAAWVDVKHVCGRLGG